MKLQFTSRLRRLTDKQVKSNQLEAKIFFLHIPKCGGSSLTQGIRGTYGDWTQQEKVCFDLDGNSARDCSQFWQESNQIYRQKILTYIMSIDRYQYVNGHFAYSERILQEFGDRWHFITLLREPVAQWFSQYFYDTREDSQVRIEQDLPTFIDSERAILMGNTYVRKLTEGIPWQKASSPAAIEQAIENLQKFSLVGVLEKLDIFAQNYHSKFKVPLKIPQVNQNPVSKTKQQQQITPEIQQKARELCQPNYQVYQAALKIINNQKVPNLAEKQK